MSLDTTALAGAFQQILLTFAQLSPTQTSLYWAVVQATEQLSAVVEQRSWPSVGLEERDTGDDSKSMNVDWKDVPDLPKKLLLEAAMQMSIPTSSPTQSPTPRVASDTTTEQGKLTDHEPVDEEPGQPGDLDPAWDEGRSNRSSSSPLSTPPTSDNEDDRASDSLGDEPKSFAASVESAPLDSVPSRPLRLAAAKARHKSASPKSAVYRRMKKRMNKAATKKDEQVVSIVAGLGSPAVMTWIQESMDHAQALQSSLVFADSADRPSSLESPMMSLFVSLGRHLSDHSTSVWVSAVLHRINLAFFDRIYQVAKTDVQKSAYSACGSSFLRESDTLLLVQGQQPACTFAVGHRSPSVVRDWLVDLIFLDRRPTWDQSRERVRARVAAMQQLGKRWQQIIDRFGYEMLLLLPSDITSNRMKLTDVQMNVLMTLLKSGRARLSVDCVAETRKVLEHTFMPYIRKQEEIFGADGGFSSLPSFPSFLTVQNSEGTSLGGSESRSPNLAGSETDILHGQDSGMLGARSAGSRHLPDLQTLDEDVDSEDEEALVDDSFNIKDDDWTSELGDTV